MSIFDRAENAYSAKASWVSLPGIFVRLDNGHRTLWRSLRTLQSEPSSALRQAPEQACTPFGPWLLRSISKTSTHSPNLWLFLRTRSYRMECPVPPGLLGK